MTRSILSAVLAAASVVGIAVFPAACETGGIGDPCTPEDEFSPSFTGFKVTQENIESRSFQCESRICLANHFQGRVTCPLGQPAKQICQGLDGACSDSSESCVLAGEFAPECAKADECAAYAGTCNKAGFCDCNDNAQCPENYVCDVGDTNRCKLFACHAPGNCQEAGAETTANQKPDGQPKDCCVPGTDVPVAVEVCGQCEAEGGRNAEKAVYCSCRCGVAEGQPEDDNFNFCDCPDTFICAEVRPNLGLGDPQLAGKYCVRGDDPIVDKEKVQVALAAPKCGLIAGQLGANCEGTK